MSQQQFDLFVGCYGAETENTIHWLNFNTQNGKLSLKHSFSGIENPSFLTINHTISHLYAVSEVDQGEIVSVHINKNEQTLAELNRQPTNGGPCYLEVDQKDSTIFTANYGNGSVIVHSLKGNGEIGNKISYYQPNLQQKMDSKVHAIRNIPHTNYYVATNLGLNNLHFFNYNRATDKFTFLFDLDVPEGSGPRHLAFHPTLPVFYIVNEFHSTILTYMYDQHIEHIKLMQKLPTISGLLPNENYGADIHVTKSGKFVYTSNRGHDSITAYKVLHDGILERISCTDVEGKWPRNFTIMPDDEHLLVANEHSNSILVKKILADGNLQSTGYSYKVNKPVCIRVVD